MVFPCATSDGGPQCSQSWRTFHNCEKVANFFITRHKHQILLINFTSLRLLDKLKVNKHIPFAS